MCLLGSVSGAIYLQCYAISPRLVFANFSVATEICHKTIQRFQGYICLNLGNISLNPFSEPNEYYAMHCTWNRWMVD